MIIGGLETESITIRDKKSGSVLALIQDDGIKYNDSKVIYEEKLPARFNNNFPDSLVEVGDILRDEEGNYYQVYYAGKFFNVLKMDEQGFFTQEGQRSFPNNNKIWTLKQFGLSKLQTEPETGREGE